MTMCQHYSESAYIQAYVRFHRKRQKIYTAFAVFANKITMCPVFLSGMAVRNFKGFLSLQEVECSAGNVKADLKVFSLKMFSMPENIVLATANPVIDECVTFTVFSSCSIDRVDTRRSKLRVLVSDMEEGEVRRYGCRVNSFDSFGDTVTSTWSISVERQSEYCRIDSNDVILIYQCWPSLFTCVQTCVSACACLYVPLAHTRVSVLLQATLSFVHSFVCFFG